MKQLVLKTIGITLAFIAVFVIIGYGVFALFFPRNTAYFYDGLGDDVKAVRYMQKAYERSNKMSDLDTLCVYAIKTDDNGLIAEHLGKLFTREDEFLTYASSKGKAYYNRMATEYVLALYEVNSDVAKTIQTASRLTKDYVDGAPLRNFLAASVSKGDKETVVLLKTTIESSLNTYTAQGKSLANSDLAVITEYLAR